MTRVLLVPDLPLERWPSMDRYAHRLYDWLESTDPGFEVRLAAQIGALTRETKDGRRSGGYPRWWAQDVDPTSLVLPGPLRDGAGAFSRGLFKVEVRGSIGGPKDYRQEAVPFLVEPARRLAERLQGQR